MGRFGRDVSGSLAWCSPLEDFPSGQGQQANRYSGTDTTGLGSRVAEVAGDDCHGGVPWVVCIQICGRVFAAGEEDRVRLIQGSNTLLRIDIGSWPEIRRHCCCFCTLKSSLIVVRLRSPRRLYIYTKTSATILVCDVAS